MKKRFIVLIDFSQHAATLLKLALKMAKGSDIEVLAVHQCLSPVPGIGVGETQSRLKEENKEKAIKKLNDWVIVIAGEKNQVNQHVTTGHIVELVLDLWKENTIDFLFTGIFDKDLFHRLLVGNTAVKLANSTDNIIIGIPEENAALDAKTLNIALVEKYPLNTAALDSFIAAAGGAEHLRFFTAVKSGEDREDKEMYLQKVLREYNAFKDAKIEVIEAKDRLDAITTYVGRGGGLLVLQKGSRNFADTFRQFFVSQVIQNASIPVIVLPTMQKQPDQPH